MNGKSILTNTFTSAATPSSANGAGLRLRFQQKGRGEPKHKLITRTLTCAGALFVSLSAGLSQSAWAGPTLSDAELRELAPRRLTLDDVPNMDHILDTHVKDKDWAIVLGKAMFWDTQAGGDGMTACASCHFQAGADPRSKNQLSPGINAGDLTFQAKGAGPGGVNYPLTENDFPFFEKSPSGKHDNDVVSSAGVFLRSFNGFTSPHDPAGDCDSEYDAVFHKDNHNVRRVEPRNTPTVINAVFNHRNFWDGRANNFFNGVNPLGLRGQLVDVNGPLPNIADPADATNRDVKQAVWEHVCDVGFFGFCFSGHLEPRWPMLENSSLASQAVGPPESIFEMSCGDNRGFDHIGRHLLQRRPLALQKVHSNDSVFGVGGPHGNQVAGNGLGLSQTYEQLIRKAFDDKWWAGVGVIPNDGDPATDFTQIEENFSLFWGLAIQLYEATLVTNQTPFDAFAKRPDGSGGDDSAMTEDQKEGLEVFLSEEGRCVFCHSGPEFTGASVAERKIVINALGQPVRNGGEPTERMFMGDGLPAVYDGGFYNIGVRPTAEDLCVGGETAGVPISFARQAAEGPKVDPESMVDAAGDPQDPAVFPGPIAMGTPGNPGEPIAVDGACKVPSVRMAAFTAPYFHSGQVASLHDVVQLYKDQFEPLFSNENIDDLDPDILAININGVEDEGIDIGGGDVNRITTFMAEALTDSRAVDEQAPFDHPELCVPNGHSGPINGNVPNRPDEATDDLFCTPAVGAQGRAAQGLPPIVPFLGIDQANF